MAPGSLMLEITARLMSSRQVAARMTVLTFIAPEIAEAARAGQFVNLLVRPGPFLRRPFSVHRAQDDQVEVLLRDVGVGTHGLLAMRPGDSLSMLGPLGTPFTMDPEGGPVALVSGGLGVAPMPLAAAQAARLGLEVHWVHGATTAGELCREWAGDQVHWATDDGSQGHPGSVVDAIPERARQILACGPNPMLFALSRRYAQAQVAVETLMGCGTGVCLGCVVPLLGGGLVRACTEGPVLRAAQVDWAALPAIVSGWRPPC